MKIKINPKDYWVDEDGYICYGTSSDHVIVGETANDTTGNHTQILTTIIETWPDLLEACKYVRKELKNVKGKAFPILPIIEAIAKAENGG